MAKAFLSHSSADKKRYVLQIATSLGSDRCVFDSLTFEEGMKTIEEIMRGLEQSDLFVVFLSEAALKSTWVIEELFQANKLLSAGDLQRIYPIIIDPNLKHDDPRIPEFLEVYNLRYVASPNFALQRIKARLIEISWKKHPRLLERQRIFVGRNSLIGLFEERIDSIDKPTPICIIASGFQSIGRSSYIFRCLHKANIVSEAYRPPKIELANNESIEDFIIKIFGLGFSAMPIPSDLMSKNLEDKVLLAVECVKHLILNKQRLLIIDDGCIVTKDRKISDWFLKVIKLIQDSECIVFLLASKFRANNLAPMHSDRIFSIYVPELEITERIGLFKRYLEFQELNLSVDDLQFFAGLQNGFPEQVFYTVDFIKEEGVAKAKKNSNLIVEYNKEKTAQILKKYEGNEFALNLLRLLAEFELVNYELIFDVEPDQKMTEKLLDEFFALGVYEYLGASNELIRLNDRVNAFLS